MPPLGGVAAIRHIKARHPRTGILALSGTGDMNLAEDALRAGADGFLSKTLRPEALVGPLAAIASGLRVLDPALLDSLLSQTRGARSDVLELLTPADFRLWGLLSGGMETADRAAPVQVTRSAWAGHIAAARTTASRQVSAGSGSRMTTCSLPSGRSNTSGAASRHWPWPSHRP